MKPTQTFLDRLTEEAAIVYDGGFGAELFQRGVQLTNSSLANETNPDEVVAVHKDYINAGSEVIGTNTFVASSLHMEMAGKNAAEAEEVTRLACEHAAAAVADFEQQVPAGPDMVGRLMCDSAIPVQSVRAAVERQPRLVIADLRLKAV